MLTAAKPAMVPFEAKAADIIADLRSNNNQQLNDICADFDEAVYSIIRNTDTSNQLKCFEALNHLSAFTNVRDIIVLIKYDSHD